MKLSVFISALGLVLQLNFTESKELKTNADLHYVGPALFEMGTEAKLVCKFNPLDGKDYIFRWQMDLFPHDDTSSHFETLVQLYSKSTIPSYRQVFTPEYAEGSKQYNMSNKILSSGHSSLTIYNVQVNHDRRHRCEIVDLLENVIASSEFRVNVFKYPTVYMDGYDSTEGSEGYVESFITCLVSHVYPPSSIKSIKLIWEESEYEEPWGSQHSSFNADDKTDDIRVNFGWNYNVVYSKYQCVVKMKLQHESEIIFKSNKSSIPILVKHPTTYVRLSFRYELAEEGSVPGAFSFQCTCDGYPINKLTIYKVSDWSVIASSNDNTSQLQQVKTNATRDMTGDYICEANHRYQIKRLYSWYAHIYVTLNGTLFNGTYIFLQEGDYMKFKCWQNARSGSYEEDFDISNATAKDSQSWYCEDMDHFGQGRLMEIIVQTRCIPQLTFEQYQEREKLPDELFTFIATCKALQGSPHCKFEMSTDHKFSVEPTVVNKTDSLTWTYKELSYIKNSPEFTCSLSNEIKNITKRFTTTARAGNLGPLAPGIIIAISLAAAVVVIGFVAGIVYYKRRGSSGEIINTDRQDISTSDPTEISPLLGRAH